MVDGANGNHAKADARVLDRTALLPGVSGRGDDDGPLADRIGNRVLLILRARESVAACIPSATERNADDLSAVVDSPPDGVRNLVIAGGWRIVGSVNRHSNRHQLGVGGQASDVVQA